ncbi:MAG: penicillin-binding protein [Rhizobiaceae bacterium]|nr:penicillin-binding protein [Rhizobiaceae bacterium]
MAKRGANRRIEPSFDEPRRVSSGRFALSEDDRVLPSGRKRKQKATAKTPRRKARRRGGMGLLGRLVYWSLVLCIWAGIAGLGVAAFYGAQLPSATTWAVPKRPPNVKIIGADDKLLANRGVTGGEALGLHEMSPYIPQAVIAIEDRRFYSHFGIDPLGVGRALMSNIIGGRTAQGGSTLTQQLAKNLFLTPERTIRRKVQEVVLALWLEQNHTKDQILEMYLNRVYFGSGSYGVEAASRRYFGKSARNVTLAEAALLAGLLKAPSRFSPARDPDAANGRAEIVLAAMRDQGMIGDKELSVAMKAEPTRAAAYWSGSENYVADYIMDQLPDLIGEVRTDIVVESTIDMTLQKLAENSIRELIASDGKKLSVSQGALVSIDNTGAVRAMVGGYDYAASQFDRASEAKRQPGSAFKPFVYLAAIEHGLTPQSIRNDTPIRIGNWTPQNYKGKYYGPVTLTTALAKSLNSVAAQLAAEVGPATVVKTAQRLGISSKLQVNASIALGTSEVTPLELTAAYVPFANGGYLPRLHFITSISTAGGKQLYRAPAASAPRVLQPETVGMMNTMMQETIRDGTAGKADFGWPAAGKTGTSQKSKDAWFIGYTANLTTGVWFGNDDGSPTKNITGGSLPTVAWRQFMAAAHEGVPVRSLLGESNRRLAPPADVGQPTADATGNNSLIRSPRAADTPTGSIKRPQAEVGGAKVKAEKSLLDIILGN